MIRVCLYARFSTDEQNDTSNEDQLRDLRTRVAQEDDWVVPLGFELDDAAKSGATRDQRPGLLSVLRLVEAGEVDLLLTESPSRLSRSIADMAAIWAELKFWRKVRWVTLSHGEMDDIKVTFCGYESQAKLTSVQQETHRGLLACIADGRSCGGRPYGYRFDRTRTVITKKGKKETLKGVLEIHPEQKLILVRIFELYDAGLSEDAIAKLLNAEGVPSPSGGPWRATTIRGDAVRGVGFLRNPIYIGKLIGGRFSWRRHPKTGKRRPFPNPPSAWRTTDVPRLRIIDDELFARVQAKLAATRTRVKAAGATQRRPYGIGREQMPKFPLSGLTKCVCGGGFTIAHRGLLQCINYRKAGRSICTNDRSIPYLEVERRVLDAVEQRLLTQDRCDEILRLYTTEMNRVYAEHRSKLANAPRELASVKRRALEILNWMQQGFTNPEWKSEVVSLGERQLELEALIAARHEEPPLPTLHPAYFKLKVQQLVAVLNAGDPAERERARQAVRNLIDKIIIPPGDALLQVEGNLQGILAAASERNGQVPVVLVAGGGFEPPTFGL
ncbi:MAG: recombinase family protein [Vicinamibacterales bacterium]